MSQFLIHTLGCKVNQYESAYISQILCRHGFEQASDGIANICIINTCTVTHKADYQSRQLVRRAIKKNPDALIVVTGCYAQVAPHEIISIFGVDYVIGNQEKTDILDILKNPFKQTSPKIYVSPFAKDDSIANLCVERFLGRTRALLKVQDGCDAYCAYCIVPYARGKSRSLALSKVLDQVKLLVQNGYREIVLTGVNLGHYGLDQIPKTNLLDLVGQLEEIKPSFRIRLSSLEPTDLSHSLIKHIAASKMVCHHLHISLQSGDDNILRGMKRGYSVSRFKELIWELVDEIPDICIGIDVMAGFPGEGEREFMNTYTLIKELPLSYLHVFPYSKRSGTRACNLPHHLPHSSIIKRAKQLRELGYRKRMTFYRKHLGYLAEVLIEDKRDNTSLLKGLTGNYIPVLLEGHNRLKNQIIKARLLDIVKRPSDDIKVMAKRYD